MTRNPNPEAGAIVHSVTTVACYGKDRSRSHKLTKRARVWLPMAIAAWLGMPVFLCAQVSPPSVTAGTISAPGERDIYTFSVTNTGARFYFDSLSNLTSIAWSLTGPEGPVVSLRPFSASDAGLAPQPVLALVPGYYRLTVEGTGGATNGYALRLIDLSAASLLTPGTLVSNTLSPGTRTDLYQFSAAAGDQFQFTDISLNGAGNIFWELIDPFNNVIFARRFASTGTVALHASGTYTLLVEGFPDNSGPVSYALNAVFQGNVPPTPFVGSQMILGQDVTGSITNAGTNAYIFTLPAAARLVFDTLTNSPNAQWSLLGPPGLVTSRALNFSDGYTGSSLLSLPPGDYQLTVSQTSPGTVFYNFRLLDLSTAQVITPGTPIFGALQPSQETAMYQFGASAGSTFFFDLYATNGPPNAYWRLVDPFNVIVASAAIQSVFGPTTLTIPGTYTLLLEGYYRNDPGNPAYRIDVIPVTSGLQTLSIGSVTSGAISMPGQLQRYVFTLPASAVLCFDSRTNNANLLWSLSGPDGSVVTNRRFNSSDSGSGNSVLPLSAGAYTLTIAAIGDATGGYQFRLFDVASSLPITPGLPVIGELNPANATQAYRFNGNAGARFYFEGLTLSGAPNAFWRCLDPYGQPVFAQFFADDGPLSLPATGIYTVLVEGYFSDPGSGTFSFNVVPVNDQSQPLPVGEIVSGTVVMPGQAQTYNFTLASRATLYFDSLTNNPDLEWSLSGPEGVVVANRAFNQSDGHTGNGVINLPAGDYLLTVTGIGRNTGGYQFRLFDLSTATPFSPGTLVSGSLNPADETVAYQFVAAAGTKVYFNSLASAGIPNAYWRCLDPFGNQLFGEYLADFGPTTLAANGAYTLLMEGSVSDPGSGTFSFNVVPVNDQSQSLTLGAVVNGSIAGPGQSQAYRFNLAASTTLYFDAQTNNGNIQWSLDGPAGRIVNTRAFTASDGPSTANPLLSLKPGDYVLTITAVADAVGPFQFRLFDIATGTLLTPGTTVGSTLNPANETQAYRFNAAAGDRFFFHWISQTGIPNAYWRLYDPYGTRVFGGYVGDEGTNVLTLPGTYTLLIEGSIADVGSGAYQFTAVPEGNVPPVPPSGIPLTIGAITAGQLPTASATNSYTFTLAAPTRLFFDSLTNSGLVWSLDGPLGHLVSNRALWNSDGSFANSSLDCPVGAYQLSLSGGPGGFAFRLLDTTNATPFVPGTIVNGSSIPASGTVLYSFTASAAERFYFHGLPTTGFGAPVYFKILNPFGDLLVSTSLNSDVATFPVPFTGTYLVSIEGQPNDPGTNGSFSFLLQPVTDHTNILTIGKTVNDAISVAGQRQFYRFSLAQPAVLFFDALSNLGFTWTLTGPPGILVDSRALWSSDGPDGNAMLNLPTGDYTLTLAAPGAATGTYSFRLLDSAAAQGFTPGQVVSGTLTPANGTSLYRFNASAGDRFYLHGLPTSGFGAFPYLKLYSPYADLLLNQPVNSDAATFSVPESGTYLISVEGRYSETNSSGSFSFLLQPVTDK